MNVRQSMLAVATAASGLFVASNSLGSADFQVWSPGSALQFSSSFNFSIGNGEMCEVSTGCVGGGQTACFGHVGQNLLPNSDFCAHFGGTCTHGYAESIAVGPVSPNTGHSTWYVGSSNGTIYIWNGVAWAIAGGSFVDYVDNRYMAGLPHDQMSGVPSNCPIQSTIRQLSYEFRTAG